MRIAVVLAAAAIGMQIMFPLAQGAMLDAVTAAVVVLLAASALAHALVTRGAGFTVTLLASAAGAGFAAEAVGVATGFPFGCYEYALDRLGPHLAGVPLVVPLAWAAGSYPVWCAVSALLSGRHGWRRAAMRVPLVAVTITAWDLYLDPQMVTMGYWTWCADGPVLPGAGQIPLTNFAGWLLVATVIALALEVATARSDSVSELPDRWARLCVDAVPLVLFLWTWLGSALAHAVFLNARFPDAGLQISASFGLLGMAVTGIPLLIWLYRTVQSRPRIRGRSAGQRATSESDLAR
ncbi:carotenoid biosynthesis protein [Hoyosella altamirensis]|uniref:Putative membrane protein n=1 Tax=Hoyosella altamirensis TaxID=616997 RepID=A0A839RQ04_9ACTN|nr:carotenoid biosynthesis protein [Hoyosella altamirensis]MBB3038885.1 putative membrane protein [Hoyosella altamirensis]